MRVDDGDLMAKLDEESDELRHEIKSETDIALEEYQKKMEQKQREKELLEKDIYKQLLNAEQENGTAGRSDDSAFDKPDDRTVNISVVNKNEDIPKDDEPGKDISEDVKSTNDVIDPEENQKTVRVNTKQIMHAQPKDVHESNDTAPKIILEEGMLPVSLAVENDGGIVSVIAQAGAVLPFVCTREYSTGYANNGSVGINLYAGERPFSSQNKLIGKLSLDRIAALPGSRPLITVKFEIRRDLSILIEAFDEGSLRKKSCFIDKKWVPSESMLNKMADEAWENRKEDAAVKEKISVLLQARETVFAANAYVRSRSKTVSAEHRKIVKTRLSGLEKKIKKFKIAKSSKEDMLAIVKDTVELNAELETKTA